MKFKSIYVGIWLINVKNTHKKKNGFIFKMNGVSDVFQYAFDGCYLPPW